MHKRLIAITALLLIIASAITASIYIPSTVPTVIAAPEAMNEVHVDFFTGYEYEVPGDVFINGEVTGKMDWHTRIVNTPDETGAVVKDLKVTLTNPDNGTPIDEWSYGDVPEEVGSCWTPDAVKFGDIKHSPVVFTPGFDASLSIDKTVFTTPDTQTVTITVTPRDQRVIDNMGIEVVARIESDVVDAVIISHMGEGEFELSQDGKIFGMHLPKTLELDIPWSVTVKLQVTPKVPKVEFRPRIPIGTNLPEESSGTTTGSSASYTNEAGTWTVSAEGDHVWSWTAKSPNGYGLLWTKIDRPLATDEEIHREIRDTIILISVIAVATGLGIYFFRKRRRAA
jgi:hypothetical protein